MSREQTLERLVKEARTLILAVGESHHVPIQFSQHAWLREVTELLDPTCGWETIAPRSICGKPAAYIGPGGQSFCNDHGSQLARRFGSLCMKRI